MIIRVSSTYNAILGRSGLNTLRAVVSTYHLLVWFLIKNRVVEMREDQQLVRHCFLVFTQNNQPEDFLCIDKLDQKENEERGEPTE